MSIFSFNFGDENILYLRFIRSLKFFFWLHEINYLRNTLSHVFILMEFELIKILIIYGFIIMVCIDGI
jgi:hypothetical protein